MTDAPIPTHLKTRLEIVLEAPLLARLLDALDRLAVTGYSVVPLLAGRGRGGSWRAEGQVSDAGRMVMVICVTDPARANEVLATAYKVLARGLGVVAVSDVRVVRADHF